MRCTGSSSSLPLPFVSTPLTFIVRGEDCGVASAVAFLGFTCWSLSSPSCWSLSLPLRPSITSASRLSSPACLPADKFVCGRGREGETKAEVQIDERRGHGDGGWREKGKAGGGGRRGGGAEGRRNNGKREKGNILVRKGTFLLEREHSC